MRLRSSEAGSISRPDVTDHRGTDVAASVEFAGAGETVSETARCLVVGIRDTACPDCLTASGRAGKIARADLGAHLPPPASLELVVVPPFCDDFDALEIIETLDTVGFRSQLRVMAPKLATRQIGLRELRMHATRQGITLDPKEQG